MSRKVHGFGRRGRDSLLSVSYGEDVNAKTTAAAVKTATLGKYSSWYKLHHRHWPIYVVLAVGKTSS